MTAQDELPLIHLWPGASFHEAGYIVGTRAGLEQLRDGITAALADGKKGTAEVSTSDGEGYDIKITVKEEDDLKNIALPYTEYFAKEHRKHAVYPWEEKE